MCWNSISHVIQINSRQTLYFLIKNSFKWNFSFCRTGVDRFLKVEIKIMTGGAAAVV
jgi:hypothetical protein